MHDAAIQSLVDLLIDRQTREFRRDAEIVEAARSLLQLLRAAATPDDRVAIVNRVAHRIGDHLFPAFIKLIVTVGESRDAEAQRLLAETFADAIHRGDVPSGTLSSWGIPAAWAPHPSLANTASFGGATRRNLDPIEFLTAWHSQVTDRPALRDAIFARALLALLRVFSSVPKAATLFQMKLRSDCVNQPAGTFTDVTRARLTALADAWANAAPIEAIVQQAIGSAPHPGPVAAGLRIRTLIGPR